MTRNFGMALALVVVFALSGAVYAYQSHSNAVIHDGQVNGCLRGNSFRKDFIAFTKAAASVRLKAWQKTHDPLDLYAAKLYTGLAVNQRKNIVVCEKAYPKP